MQGVKPCPYCGGEVEVVKLIRNPKREKFQPYRIECRHCRALVARGQGFPIETLTEAKERIDDYNKFMAKQLAPIGSSRITQSRDARRRDIRRAKARMLGPDDEANEIHDANQANMNRGGWR